MPCVTNIVDTIILFPFAASPDSGSPVHENAEHVIKVVRAKPWLVHVAVIR